MALLNPEALTYGHYECRSLDDTLPVFTDLLASEVVQRSEGAAVVRHPNTPWTLVVHEGGADAPTKPHANHYGYRVADHTEIDAAAAYLRERQAEYGLTLVDGPTGESFRLLCLHRRAGRQHHRDRVLQSTSGAARTSDRGRPLERAAVPGALPRTRLRPAGALPRNDGVPR